MLTLEETKAHLEKDLDKARKQLIGAHSQIEKLTSAQKDAKGQIQTLEKLVSEQAAKYEAAESEKAEAAADAVAVWQLLQEEQASTTRLREHNVDLEKRNEEWEQHSRELEKHNKELKQHLTELERHNTEMKEHINLKSDQSAARMPVEDSNEIIQKLQVELKETAKRVTEWEDAYRSVRESQDQTLQELATVKAALIAESEASKQAEEDVAKLDEAVISEQQRADELQRQLTAVQESLKKEIATKNEQEAEHEKIVEAERLLRQKAEKDIEVMKKELWELKSSEHVLNSEEGAKVPGKHLTQAIPPTELLDVSASKERSQLNSYSMRRRPSRYLARRYSREEEMRQHWKSNDNHDDAVAIGKKEEEDRSREEPQRNIECTGVQVEIGQSSDEGNGEVGSKPPLLTPIPLLPVGGVQTFPRVRSSTTVTRSTLNKHPVPIPSVRKSSISEETTAQADGQEGEDEVDATFKRSLTVSFAQGQNVKALGALLNQQLSLRPSDIKKRSAPLSAPQPSQQRPSAGKKPFLETDDSVSPGTIAIIGAGSLGHRGQFLEQSLKGNLPEGTLPLHHSLPPSHSASEQHKTLLSVAREEEKCSLQEDNNAVPDSEVLSQARGTMDVEASNEYSSSQPKPPNRVPPALISQNFPPPPPPPPPGSPPSEVALSVTEDHGISGDSESLSETSCSSVISSPPLSPTSGNFTDTIQDDSLAKPRSQAQVKTVLDWGQSEIRGWLEAMKMEQYFAAFQEHEITGSHLPDLDDTTMKAMGISSSHRVMLKKEAKVMRNQLEKHKKMEKLKADEEAKLEKKRLEKEAKMAKKRLKDEMKAGKKE